jgi:ABC-type bacteriocin/lantibiotic exporter with double-glycine peptidase domain
MIKKPVAQKDKFGCAVACLAFLLNKPYKEISMEIGNKKAKTKGFNCKEIVEYLKKFGIETRYHYLKSKLKRKIYKEGTIVFIKRDKRYPFGHYLIRYKNFWMDSWINWPKNKNVKEAKAGFRKRLPGKPIYAIFINRS